MISMTVPLAIVPLREASKGGDTCLRQAGYWGWGIRLVGVSLWGG